MISRNEVRKYILRMLRDQFGKDVTIDEESNFRRDFGADSLDEVEMIMAVEEEYEFTIPDKDAEKFAVVREAIDYIYDKVNMKTECL